MNFKAMNMKKGLKRFWIIGSVFWLLFPVLPKYGKAFGEYLYGDKLIIYHVSAQIIWWALLYLGFWVARGFVDDDDKKAGF